ncbi:MAG: hypothetical protein L0Y71_07530 [Gemmataceae bacterium]|nr:hypothetical protein [Gemmataceae bacterium]
MAIHAQCSHCGCSHTLEDRFAGKTIKCIECAEPFRVNDADRGAIQAPARPVPARPGTARPAPARPEPARSRRKDEDDDRPARRRVVDDDDPDDDDAPRRRSRRDQDESSSLGLILACVGGGVLVVGIAIGLAVYFLRSEAPGPVVMAQDGAPVANPGQALPPNVPNANPAPVNPPPVNHNPPPQQPPAQQPAAQQPPAQQPAQQPVAQPNPMPKQPRPPKKTEKFQPPPLEPAGGAQGPIGEWKVEPDPGIDVSRAPANLKVQPSLAGSPHLVFPSTPSHFVAMRAGAGKLAQWQIFDLQLGKPSGFIKGNPDFDQQVLSPDGKLIAGRAKGPKFRTTAVLVWGVAAKKWVTTILVEGPFFTLHEFLEDNHIITAVSVKLDRQYDVWNPKGERVHQFTRPGWPDYKHHAALSPGRKYLALAEGSRGGQPMRVVILRALKGEVVGELEVPKDFGAGVKALAFSPDGAELACYTEHFGKSRLVTWRMDKGEVGVNHAFVQSVAALAPQSNQYQGPVLEWAPDKSGWLFYGQVLIDYASGAPAHTMPVPGGDANKFYRRFVGKDHVAVVNGNNAAQQLRYDALPVAEIAANVKLARAGGDQGPAALPEPKPADVAGAKILPVPGGGPWTAQPDPAPVAKNLPPLTLRTTPAETAQVMFAPSGHTVVLTSFAPNPLAAKRFIRADRYDHAAGKLLTQTVLFEAVDAGQPRIVMPGQAAAVHAVGEVSPDGNLLAVRATKDDPRLDVWSLADSKHLAGWLPYDGDKIEWFGFVDGQRLLTLSDKGKLALWKVPECQAVYLGDGYRGSAELSPSRKYVAVLAASGIEILDTDTGTSRGRLDAAGGMQTMPACAFSQDGKSLAVIFFNANGMQIGRWDLAKGAAWTPVVAPVAAAPLNWAGPKHVLANMTLFDFNFKQPIVTYTLPAKSKAAGVSPDGRLWYCYEAGQHRTVLTAATVPDPQAADISAQAAAGKVTPLIPPGTAVKIHVNSNSTRFKTAVEQALSQRLEAMGYKTGAGGVTLSVDTNVAATGRILEYELRQAPKFGPPLPFRPGGGQIVQVTEQQVTCQSLLVDQQGMALHKAQSIIPTPSSLRFRGDDFQNELVEAMWNQAIAWGSNAPLPTNLYRINGKLEALPKVVALPGGG